jgi:hypothetical protein
MWRVFLEKTVLSLSWNVEQQLVVAIISVSCCIIWFTEKLMQTTWSDRAEYFLTRNFSGIQEI